MLHLSWTKSLEPLKVRATLPLNPHVSVCLSQGDNVFYFCALTESNSEFPSVQLQLVQYSSMASAAGPAGFSGTSALHCELCDFSSQHMSSMRRHYMNRHGKKILKCKDCEFFTGLR